MIVDKLKLFESARDRWPASFRIEPTDKAPFFEAQPDMAAVYCSTEKSCEPSGQRTQSDEWTQLANWAFHQAIWSLAEDTTEPKVIRREEVTSDLFDKWVRMNLSLGRWKLEPHEYRDVSQGYRGQ